MNVTLSEQKAETRKSSTIVIGYRPIFRQWRQLGVKRRFWRLLTTLLLLFSFRGDAGVQTYASTHWAHAQTLPFIVKERLPLQNNKSQGSSDPVRSPCSSGMIHVKGNYCPTVRHHCIHWLDDPQLPYARCGRYEPKAQCLAPRITLNFCIDREEYTLAGETLPENYLSLNLGAQRCASQNKRLCLEREWNFACEGEEMKPYPYGWSREPQCHQDRTDLYEMRADKQVLRDLRAHNGDYPKCESPFGVHNLVGNLDEPVLREGAVYPFNQTALKGGWWMPARNRCRAATTAHDAYYRGVQVGARCCADVLDAR